MIVFGQSISSAFFDSWCLSTCSKICGREVRLQQSDLMGSLDMQLIYPHNWVDAPTLFCFIDATIEHLAISNHQHVLHSTGPALFLIPDILVPTPHGMFCDCDVSERICDTGNGAYFMTIRIPVLTLTRSQEQNKIHVKFPGLVQ